MTRFPRVSPIAAQHERRFSLSQAVVGLHDQYRRYRPTTAIKKCKRQDLTPRFWRIVLLQLGAAGLTSRPVFSRSAGRAAATDNL